MSGITYLASPYSHPNPAMREARFEAACRATAKLMAKGMIVYCPIAHIHPIAVHGNLPLGWDFWRLQDEAFVDACSSMVVLMLPGWEKSKGVAAEIARAQAWGKVVTYIDPDGIDAMFPTVDLAEAMK